MFNQPPYPSLTEAQMSAQLPTAGNYKFFYNLDHDGDLYLADSSGNFTFVVDADADEDCCACAIAEQWLCAINRALNTGLMTPAQYQAAIVAGINIVATKNGAGNCTLTVGAKISRFPPTTVSISGPSTVGIGAQIQLGASSSPAGSDPSVLWVSSDPTKATVDQTGKVTGVELADVVAIRTYSVYDSSVFSVHNVQVTG